MRVVAIDGPVGSGKSTVAQAVAARLGLDCLGTGAMYRAVAVAVLHRCEAGEIGPDLENAEVAAVAQATEIEIGPREIGPRDNGDRGIGDRGIGDRVVGSHDLGSAEPGSGEMGERVVVDGEDVTDEIRSPEVGRLVSVVAAVPEVRARLVALQRDWVAARGGAVVEGRDIGSVVFPDAELKIFLTASPEERARRRNDEDADDVRRRDHLDSTRAVSPLLVADGAVVIDSTGRSVDDIVDEIVGMLGRSGARA